MQNDGNRQKYFLPREWNKPQPEHFPHVTDEERDAVIEQIRAARKCSDWRQQGNNIICYACPNRHGHTVSTNKILDKAASDKALKPVLIDLTVNS
jgi:hypothetical protein